MIDFHRVIKKWMLKRIGFKRCKKKVLIKSNSKFISLFFLCFLNDIRKITELQVFFVFSLRGLLGFELKALLAKTFCASCDFLS